MAKTRIYYVSDAEDAEAGRLVEATSAAAAIRHCAKRYTASVPSTKEVVDLLASGVQIENVADAAALELDLEP